MITKKIGRELLQKAYNNNATPIYIRYEAAMRLSFYGTIREQKTMGRKS